MIHDSVRETTLFFDVIIKTKPFQSTPPRGRRLGTAYAYVMFEQFQSTPPRGRRLYDGYTRPSFFTVSIHASAREATALITNIHLKHHISF